MRFRPENNSPEGATHFPPAINITFAKKCVAPEKSSLPHKNLSP
jgi:hypothetical protein